MTTAERDELRRLRRDILRMTAALDRLEVIERDEPDRPGHPIAIGAQQVERPLLCERGHLVTGTVRLFGANHHVRFVRVRGTPDAGPDLIEPLPGAPDGVKALFAEYQKFNPGAWSTCTLPGYEGRWVMVLYPFAD